MNCSKTLLFPSNLEDLPRHVAVVAGEGSKGTHLEMQIQIAAVESIWRDQHAAHEALPEQFDGGQP